MNILTPYIVLLHCLIPNLFNFFFSLFQTLVLSNNPIPDIYEQEIDHFPALTTMGLARLGLSQMPNLTSYSESLQILDLNANEFTSIPYEEINNFISLKNLHMRDNQIRALKDITGAPIRELYLMRNPIETIHDLPSVGATLSLLELHYCPLASFPNVSTIQSLPQLRKLQMHGTLVDSISAQQLTSFQALQELNLNSNQLQSIPNVLVGNGGTCTLLYLYLTDNQVTAVLEQ